jgi:glycine cleavage system H lipoate-binding protein
MIILQHLYHARQAEYVIALLGLFGFIAFWRLLSGPSVRPETAPEAVRSFSTRLGGFLAPKDVMFHPGHSWARLESGDTVTVGMDDFAAKLLGSADSISLPKPGSKVKQGSLGWGFKTDSRVIHMLSPVEGEVIEVNEAAATSPAAAFEDPYGSGWLFKVKSANLTCNTKNMIPASMVGEWFENVRRSLSSRGLSNEASPMLADGGEPVRGIARVVDPQRWDELAREFFLTK